VHDRAVGEHDGRSDDVVHDHAVLTGKVAVPASQSKSALDQQAPLAAQGLTLQPRSYRSSAFPHDPRSGSPHSSSPPRWPGQTCSSPRRHVSRSPPRRRTRPSSRDRTCTRTCIVRGR
jgi:hypothetical protein